MDYFSYSMTFSTLPARIMSNEVGDGVNLQETQLKEKSLTSMGFEKSDWSHVTMPAKPDICKLLQTALENHLKPDVVISVAHQTFNCFSIVLQTYSKKLQCIPWKKPLHIVSKRVTAKIFLKVYSWMLAKVSQLERDLLIEYILVANGLEIYELTNHCWVLLDDPKTADEVSAFWFYLKALKLNLEESRTVFLPRIRQSFLTVVASVEFLSMPVDDVKILLSQTMLAINSEIEIFYAIVLWVNSNWSTRKIYVEGLLKCVRWPYFPCFVLGKLLIDLKSFAIEVQRVTDYENAQSFRNELARRSVPNVENNIINKRYWIADENCPYYAKVKSDDPYNVSYGEFKEYLKIVASKGLKYWQQLKPLKVIEESKTVTVFFNGEDLIDFSSDVESEDQKIVTKFN